MDTQTQQQPQPAQGRRQKNILIPMGGTSQLETNRKLFEWCQKNILEYGDNVYVFNYNSAWRKAASAKEMASPFYAGASDEATTAEKERVGVVTVDLSDLPAGDQTKHVATKKQSEWLPDSVREGLKQLKRVGGGFVVAFQMDIGTGLTSPEEAIVEICRGVYGCAKNPAHLCVPNIDLVCIGSRGNKMLKRLVLGSVSANVLTEATVPTCVYRSTLPAPSALAEAQRKKLSEDEGQRAICIAVSGSPASVDVAEWAAHNLLRPSDRVIVLHCTQRRKAEKRGYSAEDITAVVEKCDASVRQYFAQHPDPRGQCLRLCLEEEGNARGADVRDRIVDFLEKTDVNLLILGRSHRVGGLKSRFLGTVPMYAVQHGNCPVLVVNPPPTSASGSGGASGSGSAAQDTKERATAAVAASAASA